MSYLTTDYPFLSYPLLLLSIFIEIVILSIFVYSSLSIQDNGTVNFKRFFRFFKRIHIFCILTIGLFILTLIGTALLIIPGIMVFSIFAYSLFLFFDRQLSLKEIIQKTFNNVTDNFFEVLFTTILIVIYNIIGALSLGIGLILTIPMSFNMLAQTYRKMFPAPEDDIFRN